MCRISLPFATMTEKIAFVQQTLNLKTRVFSVTENPQKLWISGRKQKRQFLVKKEKKDIFVIIYAQYVK